MIGKVGIFFTMVIVTLVTVQQAIHIVPEGHVGVYYRGGKLLDHTTEPGFNFKIPYLTSWAPVQVTLQTDEVHDIACGTSGGTIVYFEKIEVVNQLRKDLVLDTIRNYTLNYDRPHIFQKIHHEVNQFCSSHSLQEIYIEMFSQIDEYLVSQLQRDCDHQAPGIQILAVRLSKPKLPASILRNFERMEETKGRLLIAEQQQLVVQKEAETLKKRAIIEAEGLKQVSAIKLQQMLHHKQTLQKISAVEDETLKAHQKALADAKLYSAQKESEANQLQLTPQFLVKTFFESIGNNSKIFFGEKIPSLLQQGVSPSEVSALLKQFKED